MSNDFNELADRAKASWTGETHRVYEAASAGFAAQVDEQAQLGASIASARKAQALTQPALAQLAGIQQAEISRIERGLGNPTAATLLRLADALGLRLTFVSSAHR